jgi:hypothetical protein
MPLGMRLVAVAVSMLNSSPQNYPGITGIYLVKGHHALWLENK